MASSRVDSLHIHVVDFGGANAMPTSFSEHEETYLCGFTLLSAVTINNVTMPAGTRCFGYYGNKIFHGIGIPNDNKIYIIRYADGWSVLGTK